LRWARGLDPERVGELEDCRHVSGAFERFLVARGERVVRVAPKHMAGARRSARERGKSDSIDASEPALVTHQFADGTLATAPIDDRLGVAIHDVRLWDGPNENGPLLSFLDSISSEAPTHHVTACEASSCLMTWQLVQVLIAWAE
jgi:hypothetical protein